MADRVTVTLLTGFLGAGKTTLVNRILRGDHRRRYAVLVNEFGEVGIDGELIDAGPEEIVELSNGCVCCTVRGDLIRSLRALIPGLGRIDAVVIETSGLAAPAPVAQTFLFDPELAEHLALDSITAVVDALHGLDAIASHPVAREQLAFADQVVLNKTDLVGPRALEALERQVRRLSPRAGLHRVERGEVDLAAILGRGSFDLERIEDLGPEPEAGHDHAHDHLHDDHDHAHDHDHGHHHDHHHDDAVGSVVLTEAAPLDADKLTAWLEAYLGEHGADILRGKGIIHAAGEEERLVFQSVHMILEGTRQRPWRPDEPRESRMVFIGRNLNEGELRAGLRACLA